MEHFEFFQRNIFELTCPFIENCLIYLFIFTIILTHLNLIDWCYFHWTKRLTWAFKSHQIQDYTSLFCSFTCQQNSGWSLCLTGLTHLPSASLCDLCKAHFSTSSCQLFYRNFLCAGYNEEFQDWALLLFPLWTRGEGFWESKTCWEGVRAWYHQAYWKSRLMYIDFTQVLKYSGLQNFL